MTITTPPCIVFAGPIDLRLAFNLRSNGRFQDLSKGERRGFEACPMPQIGSPRLPLLPPARSVNRSALFQRLVFTGSASCSLIKFPFFWAMTCAKYDVDPSIAR